MTDDLLLKATHELLDGWCGPVMWRGLLVHCKGTVVGDEVWVCDHRGQFLVSLADLHLDLSRAECRDRVARVVRRHEPYGLTWLPGDGGVHWMVRAVSRSEWLDAAGLDPNDDTRLPDGSRLVDAQALLVVAKEVLYGD